MADPDAMYTVYAIDCEGHEHGEIDCATLEEALECLDDIVYEVSIFCEPEEAASMRYGIRFEYEGAAEIARRINQPQVK